MRGKHYALRTEKCYVQWIVRYIRFHGTRHPREMGAAEVEAFLTDLAVNGQVSASTQNQALNALVFLYAQVLEIDLGRLDAVRARKSKRLPVVLSPEEVQAVLSHVRGGKGVFGLMARLLYGCGLRLMECCRLRVKDIEFPRDQIIVRGGKGDKDRVVMLPKFVSEELAQHLQGRHRVHQRDLERGVARVELPNAASYTVSWSWADSNIRCTGQALRRAQRQMSKLLRSHRPTERTWWVRPKRGTQGAVNFDIDTVGFEKALADVAICLSFMPCVSLGELSMVDCPTSPSETDL